MLSEDMEEQDWLDLGAAAQYIGFRLRKYGRLPVTDCKTKWSEVRIYCNFGWYSFHDITHPGHHYSRYPDWLWKLVNTRFMTTVVQLANIVVIPAHVWFYRNTYKKAVAKWPRLRDNILNGADYPEHLGGL